MNPHLVRTNHLELRVNPKVSVCVYDLTVTPELPRPKMLPELWRNLVKQTPELTDTIFDSQKMIFSAHELKTESFKYNIDENSRNTQLPPRIFTLKLTKVNRFNYSELQDYLNGQQANSGNVQAIMQVINLAILNSPKNEKQNIRNVLYPIHGGPPPGRLSDTVDVRCGLFTSARAGAGSLTLNVDSQFTAFRAAVPLLKLIESHGVRVSGHEIDERAFRRLNAALTKLKVVKTYGEKNKQGNKRVLDIKKLINVKPRESTFTLSDGRETNIQEYLLTKYNISLQYPNLCCADTGRTGFIPVELLTVAPDQHIRGKLDESLTAEMIRHAAKKPRDRESTIFKLFSALNMRQSRVLDLFGVSIGNDFLAVDATLLVAPKLFYGNSRTPSITQGVWNLRDIKVFKGSRLTRIGVLNLADRMSSEHVSRFIRDLLGAANGCGMETSQANRFTVRNGRITDIEGSMRGFYSDMRRESSDRVDIMFVIIPQKSIAPYAEIKRVGDTVLGVVTQVLTAAKMAKPNPMLFANIVLKLNMKNSDVSAINCRVDMPPQLFNQPLMIVGIDISHGNPGSDAPSLATMVGSHDKFVSRYFAVTRVLSKRQEVLHGHAGIMFASLLENFKRRIGCYPTRFIVYRDGVSEGEFAAVEATEMEEILEACRNVGIESPMVAYVIVRKRHHTRFFPSGDNAPRDRSDNCPAGLFVHSKIVASGNREFFLQSQAGLQGTSKPALYTILKIVNCPFESSLRDVLPSLSFALCFGYQRCTRSVSIPAPVYYAHNVCMRARHYMRGNYSETESVVSGHSEDGTYVDIKSDIASFMYYM